MKYKVKVTNWFLEKMPNGKLPVRVGDKTELIGNGDEIITENIQGIEGDPRFDIQEFKEPKRAPLEERVKKEE